MSPLAWAHQAACLYPQQANVRESGFDEWSRTHLGRPLRLAGRGLAWHRRIAARALTLESELRPLPDAQLLRRLRASALICWQGAERSRAQSEVMALVLALVREAALRSLGMLAYEVQLIGASCLIEGQMAEMQTGEGKTLTAGLAAAVAACAGVPVHVITVNDYLARRDADELAPLLRYLSLSGGCVVVGMSLAERKAAYDCDVTYCTGKELVFDYLKDRAANGMAVNQAQIRLGRLLGKSSAPTLLHGLHFGIVDEADSVLIDEARTPLILSENAGPGVEAELLRQALALAAELLEGEHYELHRARHELHLLPAGRMWLTERCLTLSGEWRVRHAREHWVLQALRAQHLFRRDEHYIVKEGKVLIVDENTGRALPGRSWEHGLHQLVETREGCELSDLARTVARITYQRFFRRYLRLAGMTGTASEVRGELWRDYRLATVVVPTNKPCLRRLLPILSLSDETSKWERIAQAVREQWANGRPVLVGTRSVGASQRLSAVLTQLDIPHRVLNAMQDEGEAELIAQAGQAGRVTVATNMAGRGTDIKLGEGVRERGGLHVLLSEYHESSRIDRQLFGRAARQGDPGSGQAIVSLDDPLFAQHAAAWLPLARRSAAALPQTSLRCLRSRAQHAAEHLHERTRRHAVKDDERLETGLSYSGRY